MKRLIHVLQYFNCFWFILNKGYSKSRKLKFASLLLQKYLAKVTHGMLTNINWTYTIILLAYWILMLGFFHKSGLLYGNKNFQWSIIVNMTYLSLNTVLFCACVFQETITIKGIMEACQTDNFWKSCKQVQLNLSLKIVATFFNDFMHYSFHPYAPSQFIMVTCFCKAFASLQESLLPYLAVWMCGTLHIEDQANY